MINGFETEKGKICSSCCIWWNENYAGNNTTQKLTIREEIVKTDSSVSSTASSDEDSLEGPKTDSISITKG